MAVLDDLAAKLVAAGVGVTGTSIFLSAASILPSGAGPYLTLIETGGVAPTRVQGSTSATIRPTVQVAARATTYAAARTMAQNAFNALDGIFNTALSGTTYVRVGARQSPTDMGMDGAGRWQVVFNVDAERQP